MGLSSNQARLNLLTSRKADLEYRLTMISAQTQKLAMQESEAITKKASQMQLYSQQNADNDDAVSFDQTQAYADYETAMSQLELAQTRLDNQQSLIETQLSAVTNEQEQVEKLVESNVKSSFKHFN